MSVVVTRGLTNVLEGTVGTLPLPQFLTKPVINTVDEITTNVVSILKGEQSFDVEIPTVGANKVKAGDFYKFKLRRPVVLGLGSVTKETEPKIITADDIARGSVKATFEDRSLIVGLFDGLGGIIDTITGGTTVYITPVLIEDGTEVEGDETAIEVREGLLKSLLEGIGIIR